MKKKSTKKKAKFKTRYVEPVYPAEFRVKQGQWLWCHPKYLSPDPFSNDAWNLGMRVIMTGWVQGEIHVQWGFQSMQ